MEIQQIRHFLAVAETLNFTRAAELCNITQPALTRSIQGLESKLGGKLVNRERRNTHLTEFGRLMEPYFRTIQGQMMSARTAAEAFRSAGRGALRIGAMCTIGPKLVANLVARYARTYPDIEIDLAALPLAPLSEQLSAGKMDIALLAFPGEAPPGLHCVPLFDEAFTVAVARSHRFANAKSVKCAELHGEPYVNRTNCEYYDAVSAESAALGIGMRRTFSSECDEWVLGMVKANLGVGFFPEFATSDPEIIMKPLSDPAFRRTVQLATVSGRTHSPAVGAFVREARNESWPVSLAPSVGNASAARMPARRRTDTRREELSVPRRLEHRGVKRFLRGLSAPDQEVERR